MATVIQRTISDEVLDKTMRLFWEKGYFNTSIDELVALTGFNKAAIYKYFGTKHDLFVAMLKRYRANVTSIFIKHLQETPRGLLAIEKFFEQFLHTKNHSMPTGCFLVAVAAELPSHDNVVANLIRDFSKTLVSLFSACLESAKDQAQIKANVDIEAVSDYLFANVLGLMTLKRASLNTKLIAHHVSILLQYLQSLKISHIKEDGYERSRLV